MRYRAIFERASDGTWLADIPEVPRCSVSGRTIAEARQRLKEALSVYVTDLADVQIEEEISW